MKRNPLIPLTAEQQQLVTDHMNVAWSIAALRKRPTPKHVEIEEIISMAYLGLIDAARKFDPSRGIKFATYAARRIHGEISDQMREAGYVNDRIRQRAEAKGQFVPWFKQFATYYNSRKGYRGEVSSEGSMECASAQDGYGRIDELDTFNRMLVGIQEDTRFAMRLYYVEDLTMKEVGQAIGLSESRVSQMITAALKILKSRATNPGQEVAA